MKIHHLGIATDKPEKASEFIKKLILLFLKQGHCGTQT